MEHMGRSIQLAARAAALKATAQPELDLGLPPRLIPYRPSRRGMSEAMHAVAEFHATFGLPMSATPQQDVPSQLAALRVELLREEFEEFRSAVRRNDAVAIADALADIVYVAYGSAITYGIDLDLVIREVHRANMSKLGPNGVPLMREDGKVLKPRTYTPPVIEEILLKQEPLFVW